jgi:hypothetical protein
MEPQDPSGTSVSDQLEAWLRSDGDHTLGGLIMLFEERAFAVLFVILLALPALPLPTGGATHLFEIIAILLAFELIVGREHVWLPERWRKRTFQPEGRAIRGLLRVLRFLERHSRPRFARVIDSRPGNLVFGIAVVIGSLTAFLAPPFSGLDTIPALGVVILSAGALVKDSLLFAIGMAVIAVGIGVVIVAGQAVLKLITMSSFRFLNPG